MSGIYRDKGEQAMEEERREKARRNDLDDVEGYCDDCLAGVAFLVAEPEALAETAREVACQKVGECFTQGTDVLLIARAVKAAKYAYIAAATARDKEVAELRARVAELEGYLSKAQVALVYFTRVRGDRILDRDCNWLMLDSDMKEAIINAHNKEHND